MSLPRFVGVKTVVLLEYLVLAGFVAVVVWVLAAGYRRGAIRERLLSGSGGWTAGEGFPAEGHFYVEAAVRAGGEGGAVGVGDGADDGQAESVSLAGPGPLGAESPEWLEQVFQRIGRDWGAGVADRDGGACGGLCGGYLDLAAGQVVPDGVVDEVADQAFGQARVAGGGCGRECCVEVDATGVARPGGPAGRPG